MAEYGLLVDVSTANVGDFLTADAPTSTTVLYVGNASVFEESGGSVSVGGVAYQCLSVDTVANTITLTSGLTADAFTDDPVEIWPAQPEKRALVDLGAAEGEAVFAIVPHSLTGVIQDGFRPEGQRESVLLEYRGIGELYIADVSTTPPELSGVQIVGDGDPPIASPTPVVTGWVGALHVKWAAISGPDAISYQVHISTTSDFTPDASTLVGTTAATSFTIRTLPNDLLLAYATTYYVKVVAYDIDGPAPAGSQGSAEMMPVNSPDIAATYIYAGEINASQINGGEITADLVLGGKISTRSSGTGAGVDQDATGIVIYDPAGVPQTTLAPDLSVFKGDADIGGLVVTGSASVRGTSNELASGAELKLSAGITTPASTPSVVQDWEWIQFTKAGDSSFDANNLTSLQRVGTLWVCGYRKAGTDEYYVYRFNADGTFNSEAADMIISSTAWQTTQIVSNGRCYSIATNHTLFWHRQKTADYTHIWIEDFTSSIPAGRWPSTNGAVWDSGTASAKLTGSDAGDVYIRTAYDNDMKNSFVSAKVTRTGGTDNQDFFLTLREVGSGNQLAEIKLTGSSLIFRIFSAALDGSTIDFTSSLTYNSTTHAYWRIMEQDTAAGGDIIFSTSSNGTSWTERFRGDHDFSVAELTDARAEFLGQEEGGSGTLVVYVDEVRHGLNNESFSVPFTTLDLDNNPMTIGNDGTNLLLADHDNGGGDDRIRVRTIDPTTLLVSDTFYSANEGIFDAPLAGVLKGSFDFGASRIVTKRQSTASWRVIDASAGTHLAARGFPAAGVSAKGLGWDGSNFWELAGGKIYKHTGIDPTDDSYTVPSFKFGYTWYDSNATGGTHETQISPLASVTLNKRARVTITAPDLPGGGGTDDPNCIRIYAGTNAGSKTLQVTTGTGVHTAVLNSLSTGGSTPPGSNNFPSGTPAKITAGGTAMVLSGDGSIKGTDVQATGKLVAANRVVGSVSITPSAADTPTSQNVTFPQTLTGTNFYGQVSPGTAVPGTTVKGVGITNLSSTGCTIWLTRGNTTATTIFYTVEGV